MQEELEDRFNNLFQELLTKEHGLEIKNAVLETFISRNSLYFCAFDNEEKIIYHNLPNRKNLNFLSDAEYILQKDVIGQIRKYMALPLSHDPLEITLKGAALEFVLFTNKNCEGIFFLQISFFKNHITAQNAGNEEAYSRAETSVNNLRLTLNILEEIRNIESVPEKQQLYQEIQSHYLPALEQLQLSIDDPIIRVCLEIIRSNLNDVIAPSANISSLYEILTPSEIKVAEFIRMGKSSQDIAEALEIARKTVENHRNSLRDKLGLKNKGVNLRSYLLNLDNT